MRPSYSASALKNVQLAEIWGDLVDKSNAGWPLKFSREVLRGADQAKRAIPLESKH